MTVGYDQRAEGLETVERIFAVLLRLATMDLCAGSTSAAAVDATGLPDEVLDEVALILCEKKCLCILNYITQVVDQMLTLG